MSLNKCMIIGNLGRDPEMRYTPSGQAVTQFTVATNRNYRDAQGEWQSEAEWFRVVVWGQQAERTAERLRKGHKVYVEGRIQTRQWEDQTGNKRYTTELVANQVSSLERRERDEDAQFGGDDRPSGSRGAGSTGPGSSGPGSSDAGSSDVGSSDAGPGGGSRSGTSAPSGAAPSGGEDDFDDLPF